VEINQKKERKIFAQTVSLLLTDKSKQLVVKFLLAVIKATIFKK